MSSLEAHEREQAAITAACEAGVCDHQECCDARNVDDNEGEFEPNYPSHEEQERHSWEQV